MSKSDNMDVMVSFRCEPYIAEAIREKHRKVVERYSRLVKPVVVSEKPLVINEPRAITFSLWVRRELEVLARRVETDYYYGSCVNWSMKFLHEPSTNDFLHVLLANSIDSSWTGFTKMKAYERLMKIGKAAKKHREKLERIAKSEGTLAI